MPRGSKITRFNPFLEDGLIRLGGRLQCAGLSTDLCHPILLNGKHHFLHLLIWQTHIRLHHLGVRIILSELREEFWILRARQAIKKTDMSTDKFLLALQRFVGRRLPHTVYTDNAQTFHATNKHLAELWFSLFAAKTHHFFAQHNICWKFIVLKAAWWGGWWERMIGTMKRCLCKVLGRSQVSEERLNTTLVAIQAAINSRPIVQAEDEAGELTPAHFLTGERLTAIPAGPEPETNGNLTKEFSMRPKHADEFWR